MRKNETHTKGLLVSPKQKVNETKCHSGALYLLNLWS